MICFLAWELVKLILKVGSYLLQELVFQLGIKRGEVYPLKPLVNGGREASFATFFRPSGQGEIMLIDFSVPVDPIKHNKNKQLYSQSESRNKAHVAVFMLFIK